MPRRVRLATLLAFCLHGFLILTARYHLSFDAYTHMLLADHYRMDWWSLWEPRWYTGFSVTSYPPLVHQIMGLLGHLIGVDAAFALVLWTVLTAYPVAIYAFSRVFSGRAVAGYAALGAAVLPSIYMSAHNFGQIPTVTATLFALFALATLAEFLRHGRPLSGALAVALGAVVMAAHHATLLFLPWIVFGLVIHLLINRICGWRSLITRMAIVLPLAVAAGLAVIWPFWAWGLGQTMQVPIDHLSRHNFLADPTAILVFFLPMYGLLMFLIPFALWSGRRRPYTGLSIAFLPLFILGLGGTTPLPRLLFGAGWEWLTYDRFAFWASLVLLPFFGVALLLIRRRLGPRPTNRDTRPGFAAAAQKHNRRTWVTGSILGVFGLIAMIVGLLPSFMPFQPAPIDMQPIVDFLARDDHSQWRYLTFGFGDQFAYLSRLTRATTIDGSYHTARMLPELRDSGLPQIDVAYWTAKGVTALGPILQMSGGHGVRWGFVNLQAYVPVLMQNGWVKLATLRNGIQVWENPSARLPGPSQASPYDPLASISWGILPLLSLAITGALAGLRFFPDTAQKALFGTHQFLMGLLPPGLCLWYYIILVNTQVPDLYFNYTDALLFLGDALGLIAVLAWVIARYLGPRTPRPSLAPTARAGVSYQAFSRPAALNRLDLHTIRRWLEPISPLYIERWMLALCLLASLSILWSPNWRISLYFSLQLWLVFGVFLSLQDRPQVWRSVAFGFCAALVLQVFIGLWQFAAQSTLFMKPLGLDWPGGLVPATRGVSVVELLDGTRWLRVYGSLPHPNILGGVIVAFIAGPVVLLLTGTKRAAWKVALFALSIVLLVLTFSRGAWLGLAAAALIVLLHHRSLPGRRLLALLLAGLTGLLLTAVPLYSLIFTRVGAVAGVGTEEYSNAGRLWLIQVTLGIIRSYPGLGVGVGTYLLEYIRRSPPGYLIEPVHNLPLLVIAELGLAALVILLGLGLSILRGGLQARRAGAIIFSAALIGLVTTAMFDHYLWSLAPGRLLLGLMLGLWAGQIRQDTLDANAPDPL